MVSMNLHNCKKITASNGSTEDGETTWTTYIFYDENGKLLLEIGVFEQPPLEVLDNE